MKKYIALLVISFGYCTINAAAFPERPTTINIRSFDPKDPQTSYKRLKDDLARYKDSEVLVDGTTLPAALDRLFEHDSNAARMVHVIIEYFPNNQVAYSWLLQKTKQSKNVLYWVLYELDEAIEAHHRLARNQYVQNLKQAQSPSEGWVQQMIESEQNHFAFLNAMLESKLSPDMLVHFDAGVTNPVTAFQFAKKNGHDRLAELLQAHGADPMRASERYAFILHRARSSFLN